MAQSTFIQGQCMSGKGSGRRPMQIDEKEAEANWNRIFGKKPLYVPLEEHFNLLLNDPDGFNTMDNLIENPKEEQHGSTIESKASR